MVENRLKEIRMKEYMMSQTEFSAMLNIEYPQYNRYEKGVTPALETALKISTRLNKPIEEIFILSK